MKRIILGLAFTCAFAILGVSGVNAATPEKCFTFDKSTKTITRYNLYTKLNNSEFCADVDKIEVPNKIEGVSVERIGNKAFYGIFDTQIRFPKGIKVFEKGALHGVDLSGVSLDAICIPAEGITEADFSVDPIEFSGAKVISTYLSISGMNGKQFTFNDYKNNFANFSEDEIINQIITKESFGLYCFDGGYNVITTDPTLYFVEQTGYNKVRLEYEAIAADGFDQVEIYKYNYQKKKYYLYTTTANKERKTLVKNINLGERHKFKVRFVYKNVPYFTDGTVGGTKGGTLKYKTYYSPYSNAESVIVNLSKPKNVKARTAGSKKVRVSWKSVEGATKYRVYKLDRKAKKYKSIGVTKKTSLVTNKKTKKGEKAWYKVKAIRTVNGKDIYGPFSAKVSVRVK